MLLPRLARNKILNYILYLIIAYLFYLDYSIGGATSLLQKNKNLY
jgi:hypothetical protein